MVTVVLPAYNEEDIIERSVTEWHEQVISKLPGAELLVVDDCSTDRTGKILDLVAKRFPAMRVVRPKHNGGHGKALLFGFRQVRTEYVFHADSDRQHLPAEFWSLWKVRGDLDFVFGVRSSRADGALRKANSMAMQLLVLVLWGLWIRDANCPFKLMRRSALERIQPHIPEDCFIPMVILSVYARKGKAEFVETPVTHLARQGGSASLKGWRRLARVAFICAKDLIVFRISKKGLHRSMQALRPG